MLRPIGVFYAESTQEAGGSVDWLGFGKLRPESSACQEELAGKAARSTQVSEQCDSPEGDPSKAIPYQSRASTASPTANVIKASFAVVLRLCGAVRQQQEHTAPEETANSSIIVRVLSGSILLMALPIKSQKA